MNSNENDLKALLYLRKHKKIMALGRSTMHGLDGDESTANNSNSGCCYNINGSAFNSI